MRDELKRNIDLGEAFNHYFLSSDHAFCLWNNKDDKIIQVNSSFQRAFLNSNFVSTNIEKFVLKRKAELRQNYVAEDIYLIEFDEILFQKHQKSFIDYERMLEEYQHSNMQAEELGEKLNQSQKKFYQIAKVAPVGILFTNSAFKITWSNHKGFELFGSKAIINQSLGDLTYVDEILQFHESLEKLSKNGTPMKFKFTINNLKDGKEYFINCHGVYFAGNELNKNFVFILEDDTENTFYSEELKRRNLELTQINNELDKFLYSVSHNIRGPIASLEGLLNVIKISDIETVSELKHHLRLNLRLLNSFVEDIQNVATNIHSNPKKEEVNLHILVDQFIKFFSKIYKVNPNINLEFDSDFIIYSDFDRLSIVVKNILKNAFLYRDENKNSFDLTIKARKLKGYNYLEIIDNGIGIKADIIPKIFNMFFRGTELSLGNGLGLYNVREILKKMGGRINIESKYRMHTIVKIYIPISHPAN